MSKQNIGTVTADVLSVRPRPSTRQAPIAELHRGQVVRVLFATGDRAQIEISGGTGYVTAQHLQTEERQTILSPDLGSLDELIVRLQARA